MSKKKSEKKANQIDNSAKDSVEYINTFPNGVLVIEADGVVTSANQQAIECMGIPENKLLGAPLVDLIIPEFQDSFKKILDNPTDEVKLASVLLAKDLNPVEFSVKKAEDENTIVSVRSMQEEYRLSAKAGAELTHDQLTGLPNQYHVLSELNRRMNLENPKPLAIICVWVDELNSLVESHGIRAVERIISEVGSRIELKLRAPDMLGRYESSGFLAILSSDAAESELATIVDRLRSEIAFPVHFDQKLVSFTASAAYASLLDKKPSIERILALLEASDNRAANSEGNRTDILKL